MVVGGGKGVTLLATGGGNDLFKSQPSFIF